jgi:hypothetical protein
MLVIYHVLSALRIRGLDEFICNPRAFAAAVASHPVTEQNLVGGPADAEKSIFGLPYAGNVR